jgi:hypothetical protein
MCGMNRAPVLKVMVDMAVESMATSAGDNGVAVGTIVAQERGDGHARGASQQFRGRDKRSWTRHGLLIKRRRDVDRNDVPANTNRNR